MNKGRLIGKIFHTLSVESDNAASEISLGAERIWPDGDKVFGMCSIVRYLTKIRFESLMTMWPLSPSNAQQFPGVLSADMARAGEFR